MLNKAVMKNAGTRKGALRWTSTVEDTNEICFEIASRLVLEIQDETAREYYTGLINLRSVSSLALHGNPVLGSASDTYYARQILALFQKRGDLVLEGVDKKEVALRSFVQAERLCADTNNIFRMRRSGSFFLLPGVESVLHRASRKISSILGDVPLLSELHLRFGPGATTNLTKRSAHARYKLAAALACSEDLVPTVQQVVDEAPLWALEASGGASALDVEIHPARISFVPKNCKTDRGICVEPMLNGFVQLGYGDHIAERLRSRAGQDIRDQRRNQNAARLGSLTGKTATIDLSSASDTIATELVWDLLPFDWAQALSNCRSGSVVGVFPEQTTRLEKFSSMGNGFTFPLETLIFYALAASCVDDKDLGEVSVYGDDIIIPTYAYPLLEKVLRCCGFVLNQDKSFSDGPFRESCGKDYYQGIDVRPCYIKGALTYADLYVLHNYFVSKWEDEVASMIVQWIPEHLRLWGPAAYGDGHLHVRNYERSGVHRRHDGWSGYTFESFALKSRKCFKPAPGDYVYAAYSTYVGRNDEPPRERRFHPKVDLRTYWNYAPPLISEGGRISYRSKGPDEPFGVVLPGDSGYKRISIYTLG